MRELLRFMHARRPVLEDPDGIAGYLDHHLDAEREGVDALRGEEAEAGAEAALGSEGGGAIRRAAHELSRLMARSTAAPPAWGEYRAEVGRILAAASGAASVPLQRGTVDEAPPETGHADFRQRLFEQLLAASVAGREEPLSTLAMAVRALAAYDALGEHPGDRSRAWWRRVAVTPIAIPPEFLRPSQQPAEKGSGGSPYPGGPAADPGAHDSPAATRDARREETGSAARGGGPGPEAEERLKKAITALADLDAVHLSQLRARKAPEAEAAPPEFARRRGPGRVLPEREAAAASPDREPSPGARDEERVERSLLAAGTRELLARVDGGDTFGALRQHLLEEARHAWRQIAPRAQRQWVERTGNLFSMPVPAPGGGAQPQASTAAGPSPYFRVLGVGDFFRVEETPVRYLLGEVAHIENVLPGESFDRVHKRLLEQEETVTEESLLSRSEERDLESTDRFEMQAESRFATASSSSFETSMDVSASYGPVSADVGVSASGESSLETANSQASNMARETVERTRSRVEESVRTQRTTRVLSRVTERHRHAIENRGPDAAPISAIYRWVDKIHRCRLLNYGPRVLLEFYVPEPAALLLESLAGALPPGFSLEEPVEPRVWEGGAWRPLRPEDIAEWNFAELARDFNALDVEPPPAEWQTLGHTFDLEGTGKIEKILVNGGEAQTYWDNTETTRSTVVKVPPGYEVWRATANLGATYSYGGDAAGQDFIGVRAVLGDMPVALNNFGASFRKVQWFSADLPPRSLKTPDFPISITVTHPEPISVVVEMLCRRTAEHFRAWQVDTFRKILLAHQRSVDAFHAALDAARARTRSFGTHPLANRSVERRELKRAAIAALIQRHFTGFGAIVSDEAGFPFPGPEAAQPDGRQPLVSQRNLVIGMEEHVDWDNMTYTFYPYYWGRKEAWLQALGATSPDPLHERFLQAGAARVVVPLKVGTESRLLPHLFTIETGQPLTPDTLTLDQVAFADELRRQKGLKDDPEVVDEWEVRLPTSLVYLQAGATLPLELEPAPTEGGGAPDG